MLGDFFWRSAENKRRVNKKQNVEIDSPAPSGGKGKYMRYVIFLWPPHEAELSIINVRLSC